MNIHSRILAHAHIHYEFSPPTYSCLTGVVFDQTNLVENISKAINTPSAPLSSPQFLFEMTTTAANANWEVLRRYGRCLASAIDGHTGTPLQYGSEFRSVNTIRPVLGSHPLWPRIEALLTDGSTWALDPVDDADRLNSVITNIDRGNHKSARDRPDVLRAQVLEDVTHGFALPIPAKVVPMIPGAEVAPMGLVAQNTINELGEIMPKDRLTHDQSFEIGNNRVRMEDHQPVVFGHALRRLMHFVVDTRRRHPTTPILLQKVDFKAAYRRAHLSASTAAKSITTLNDIALVALRLTFGGRPCPSEWCNISEAVADLSRAILACPDWDPASLHSPQQRHVGVTELLDNSVPFASAEPLAVSLPADDQGTVEPYIDDIIAAMLDSPSNRPRLAAATLLAIHTVGRPVTDDEPLPRDDLASIKKLLAEGTPAEIACVLGWDMDTRQLLLSLPKPKFLAWTNDIDQLLAQGKATRAELDTLVGRLNHVGYIIPAARHFLSSLRDLLHLAKQRSPQPLSDEITADLHLWQRFLRRASQGMNMNLLTYRQPTREYISDACEHGIGGFSSEGRAWRFELPEDLRGRFTLNFLEFIAAIIGPWVDLLEGNLPPLSCILSGTDSTTAEGWLHRTNFSASSATPEDVAVKLAAARQLADILIESNSMLYSQWFRSDLNPEADSLSRDTHLTDQQLTEMLRLSPLCQLPENFRIAPHQTRSPPGLSPWGRACPCGRYYNCLCQEARFGLDSMGSLPRIHRHQRQPLPPRLRAPRANTHPRSLRSRRPKGHLFEVQVTTAGCVNSPRFHLICMCVLPAPRIPGPRKGRPREPFIPFITAAKRVQTVGPIRETGKGNHWEPPSSPRHKEDYQHRRRCRNRTTGRRRVLLCHALMRILQSLRRSSYQTAQTVQHIVSPQHLGPHPRNSETETHVLARSPLLSMLRQAMLP